MDLIQDIRPVSELKRKTAEIVGQVVETKRPVLITQGGRSVVMVVEVEDYQKKMRRMQLLESLAVGRQEIYEGKGIPQSDVLKKLEQWTRKSK